MVESVDKGEVVASDKPVILQPVFVVSELQKLVEVSRIGVHGGCVGLLQPDLITLSMRQVSICPFPTYGMSFKAACGVNNLHSGQDGHAGHAGHGGQA